MRPPLPIIALIAIPSTASIHFSNGTAVDIAKVEGSPAYKQLMRTTDVLYNAATTPRSASDASLHNSGATQGRLRPQSYRDYLPPWLGGHDYRLQPLPSMLRALKVATESYLESPLSDAEVVVPFPVTNSFLDTLRSACSSLSLSMPLSAQPPAGILAARTHGFGGQCDAVEDTDVLEPNQQDDPEQLILTIDYSRAAMTAMLVFEECSLFEFRRVLHDTQLGTDGLSGENDPRDLYTPRDLLARALRNVTSLPLEDGNGAGLKRISELVLLGESAGDPLLHDALTEVLSERSYDFSAAAWKRPMGSFDPLFAASRGLALDCWDRLSFHDRSERGDEL